MRLLRSILLGALATTGPALALPVPRHDAVASVTAAHADIAEPAPADLLDHLDTFRDGLSPADRRRLDQHLPRSPDGGIMACDRSEGSRASCEAAAYLPALHAADLMRRFLASPGPIPSAQWLLRDIAQRGPAIVAASLSPTWWDVACDAAAVGKSDWIAALAALRPATDASRSEDIDLALSDALLTDPATVLRWIAADPAAPGTAWLCRDRSIEPSATDVATHDAAAAAALRRVDDPTLAAVRDRCLATLRDAPNGSIPVVPPGYETRAQAVTAAMALHRRMDANADGDVTPAEMAAFVVKAMNGLAIPGTDAAHPLPPVSARFFAAADRNGDGRISTTEARDAAERAFALQDTNHDGLVSPAERMAFLQKEIPDGQTGAAPVARTSP